MKCVIMAGGRGQRMMPLTKNTPKSLLKVGGKCLIDHIIESLPDEITEIIIVIVYQGEKIKKHVEEKYKNRKIIFVKGSEKGVGKSMLETKPYLTNERFLFIYGDEIPNPINVQRCLMKDLSFLVYKQNKKAEGWSINGIMVLNTDIFENLPIPFGDNYFFLQMISRFQYAHNVFMVKAINFIGGINTPEDIERAEKWLKSQ